jgi:hypothetical protein
MSDLSFRGSTPESTRAATPSRWWGLTRLLAISGLILICLALIGGSLWLWTLTAGAPTGWRLRTLLPNALVGVPCALGCAIAAFSHVLWRRRIGWGLVFVTLLAQCALTWYWIPFNG